MKSLLLALAAVSLSVVATFVALNALGVQKELAGSAAGIFLGAIPYIHKRFERFSKRPIPALTREAVVTLKSYALPNLVLFVYASLIAIGASQVIGGVGIAVAMAAVSVADMALPVAGLLLAPIQLAIAFVIGRWIGVRSRRRGVLIVLAVFFLSITFEHVLRLKMFDDAEFAAAFGVERSPWLVIGQWGGGVLLWWSIALLGFWRGRRRRLIQYADYLLRKLPPDTRDTVLLLLRDEVAAVANARSVALSNGVEPAPQPLSLA